MNMFGEFQKFIKKYALFEPGQKILLAISGGLDSVVMLHLFAGADYRAGVAHADFQLRGEESDQDREFVEDLAKSYGFPFHQKKFDTRVYASNQKISVEMAARELRYHWFNELMVEHDYEMIATAHHQGDQVETVMINLLRGTGLAGLKGMEWSKGQIIRPLMFAGRDQIRKYAEEQNLKWREDSSNLTDEYRRNFLRHQVIPVLREINPNLEQTIFRNSVRLLAAENVLKELIAIVKEQVLKSEGKNLYLDLENLKRRANPYYFFYEILQGFGFNFWQIETIWEKRSENSGLVFYSNSYRAFLDRDKMYFESLEEEVASPRVIEIDENQHDLIFSDGLLQFRIIPAANYRIDPRPEKIALDYAKLVYPLILRYWKSGDSFYPLGMAGKKKLSDFMIDSKIPLNLKKKVLLLESAGKIVWVVGHRLDNRFKVTSETKQILEITWYKDAEPV